MAQQTLLTRYTPAVVTIVGIAAVVGGFLAYTHAQDGPIQYSLRRSNAVHHRRPSPVTDTDGQIEPTVVISDADSDGPLGYVMIRYGTDATVVPLGIKKLPRVVNLEDLLDMPPRTLSLALEETIVLSALTAAFRACKTAHASNLRGRIIDLGYERLMQAVEQHDIVGTREQVPQIAELLNRPYDRSGSTTLLDAIDSAYESEIAPYESFLQDSPTFSAAGIPVTEDGRAGHDDSQQEPTDELKGLLYHIAEEQARRKAYEHRGINCECCGESPIRGTRWHCLNCPDYDLCSSCEAQTVHPKTHVFVKIKIPLPVLSQPSKSHSLWYPGDPRKLHPSLDPELRKSLVAEYSIEEPAVDALYDQFTTLANVPYHNDATSVKAGIDRRAFNKALSSERWPSRFAPNAMYDRMFAFYDTDNNGLIGFQEFMSGLSYLRGPKRGQTLDRALRGYDLDDDGFVNREDFLRLFRAKYIIQKQLTSDMIESEEAEQTFAIMDVLRSSQPISSVFSQEEIPQGSERPRFGKEEDVYGDMQPLRNTKTFLEDDDAWVPRSVGTLASRGNVDDTIPGPEVLRRHLSRFEELLYEDEQPRYNAARDEVRPETTAANVAPEGAPRIQFPFRHFSALEPWAEPTDEDVLWQVVEEGLNEMLDPIFKRREKADIEVSQARPELKMLQKDIQQYLQERNSSNHCTEELAVEDPLLAEASKSYGDTDDKADQESSNDSSFQGEIISTDQDTLAKRERTILERPLADLLSATGYGIINENNEGAAHSPLRFRSEEANEMFALSGDPTLSPAFLTDIKSTSSPTPNETYIAHLASMQARADVIDARGGPGRLSFVELQTMVDADSRKELRGLVMSWLEWASF